MKSYDSKIARLGNRRWHIVRTYGIGFAATACNVTLTDGDYGERLGYRSNGEPTCKHCLRWWAKQEEL